MWSEMLTVIRSDSEDKQRDESTKLQRDQFEFTKGMEERRLALEERREQNAQAVRLKELENAASMQKLLEALIKK